MTWDGFYAGYMSGLNGQGFAMFVFANGVIVGSDPLGVEFDGTYTTLQDGSLKGDLKVKIPAGGVVIQGVTAGPSGMTYHVPLAFAADVFAFDFLKIETPLGPVNLRMKKLREWGDSQ